MPRVDIKPITVNQCWRGRRFKTPEYKRYERDLLSLLPKIEVPDGYLQLVLKFGFSSLSSDWDNPIKPLQDVLQKKYGFNDNRIKRAVVDVQKVKKGAEFVDFEILEFDWKNEH